MSEPKSTATEEGAKRLSNPDVEDAVMDREHPGPHIPLDEVVEQASYPEPDYILRQMLKGDESASAPGDRNKTPVGFDDTPNDSERGTNDIERGRSLKNDR